MFQMSHDRARVNCYWMMVMTASAGHDGNDKGNGAPDRETALALLRWQAEIGVDLALSDAPADRFAESKKAVQSARQPSPQSNKAVRRNAPGGGAASQLNRAPQPSPPMADAAMPDKEAIQSARDLAARADTVDALRDAMASFTGCNLRLTAKNLVFADGSAQAEIMAIGEAPGAEEDRQGLPFVGRSGHLLDKMLEAIGLSRQSVYITNVIAWRPPGNRTPTPAETEICRPFIERHIELVAPKTLLLLGGASAKTLLNTQTGILRLRGNWTSYRPKDAREDAGAIDALPMLHPAYLLRQPAQKALAWRDLLTLRQRLDSPD